MVAYLTARLLGPLPAGLVRMLHRRTEGQPLFMVQAVDTWVRQGWVTEVAGRWAMQVGVEAVATGVLESVRQLILQEFDGLSPAEQRILEAAGGGGAISTAAVAAAVDTPWSWWRSREVLGAARPVLAGRWGGGGRMAR